MLHQSVSKGAPLTSDLVVDRASVSVGRAKIVKDISFPAKAGELLAIIGPSGSGKTTLMRAMTGEMPYAGAIRLAGLEVNGLAPEFQAELRGVLPQSSQISFPLNVSEVVGLGLIDRRRARQDRSRRIAEALGRVGLAGFEGRTYQDLSGGEQQRVQLARVLCQVWDPAPADGPARWLFLDEPVSSLDIKHQYQIMRLAAAYAAGGGGVVAVMHDLNLTAAFANKVLVMRNGERLAFGVRDEVMQPELLSKAYDFPLEIVPHAGCRPVIVPASET